MRQQRIEAEQTDVVKFNPADLLSIEEVAARLKTNVAWVREKIRRRCSNPMPVYNLGRHLLFDWQQVSEWIRNCPRPVHGRHVRRTKRG
jgi:excisionase family DNA binding protein